MVGETISHYKITEKIGQGGMGEVYRAEDTNLKREVAIKVLPEQFTQDPQRLARFEREAQLLASLSHPNIAAVYSFEHAEDLHFLVMELVEGEDLSQKIARGPLPVEEVLEVCLQVAEGVEAAHEKGVIHGDLKPANVTRIVMLALLLAGIVSGVQPVLGAPIAVDTPADVIADDGQCSLREAVTAANTDTASGAMPGECPAGSGNDIITLPAGTHMLTAGSMLVVETVDINGVGSASTIIDGGGVDRFFVTNTGTLTLTGLTLQNGNINTNAGGAIDNCCRTVVLTDSIITGNSASGGGALAGSNGTWILTRVDLTGNDATCCAGGAIRGGGIRSSGGSWTLSNVTIDSNTTNGRGGGIWDDGGIWTLTDVTISNNSASTGGGISGGSSTNLNIVNGSIVNNTAITDGGGIASDGDLTLTNTLVDGNSSNLSGGLFLCGNTTTIANSTISNNAAIGGGAAGGIWNECGTLTIDDSTISGNTSTDEGGGITLEDTVVITDSTISGNTATNTGGGIFDLFSDLTLNNVTVSGNSAGSGGGIFVDDSLVNVKNTIIADNPAGGDCFGGFNSLGNNLDSDGTCPLGAAGDLPNTNPLLGPLQNNGGPTLTHALLAGSPAIDAGDNGFCSATDQRGIARPQGPNCDIGAFEAASGGTLPGDGNGDGIVNAVDLVICVEALETSYLAACDTDGDGDVDLDDIVEIVVQAFLPASH